MMKVNFPCVTAEDFEAEKSEVYFLGRFVDSLAAL
jgi:hypothetical protein